MMDIIIHSKFKWIKMDILSLLYYNGHFKLIGKISIIIHGWSLNGLKWAFIHKMSIKIHIIMDIIIHSKFKWIKMDILSLLY